MNLLKNKTDIFWVLIFTLILGSVYYRWFTASPIIGGDWPYYYNDFLKELSFLAPSWNTWQGNGLGGTSPLYYLKPFEYLTTAFVNFLHIPWPIIYKVFWFGLFLFFSFFTSLYLLKTIFSKISLSYTLLAGLIYTTNTYILMVVGGGQMGVALAYSVVPLVLVRFIKLIDYNVASNKNFQLALLAGLVLAMQVMFDPRIAYITMIGVSLYFMLNTTKNLVKNLYLILFVFAIPAVLAVLLHAAWILPILISKQSSFSDLGSVYTDIGIVKFLSFSDFSRSLSLLHPNWPENLFGKTYFMRSEFLLLPILAFSSLFFLRLVQKRIIIFFAFLGLLGAFLAKGANPPFGEIYLWLFGNFPGFEVFRDPTKFYLLTALSYSVLIPYSLWQFVKVVSSVKYQALNSTYYIMPVAFLVFWVNLIHPAIFGQLGGTFKMREVPKEYIELKDFLYKQPEFFRTLWIPRQQRFTFFSNIHPSVEAEALFSATSSAQIIENLKKPESEEYLSSLSIKYVLVPYDNLGEIFQKDRGYDQQLYENTIKGLEHVSWLKKINGFGKIQVFAVSSPKKHFYLEGDGKIFSKMISPTNYLVDVAILKDQNLIFSERYNSYWTARINGETIASKRTPFGLNSFSLKKGDYNLEVIFLQDRFYNYGRAISLVIFLGVLFFAFKYKKFNALPN